MLTFCKMGFEKDKINVSTSLRVIKIHTFTSILRLFCIFYTHNIYYSNIILFTFCLGVNKAQTSSVDPISFRCHYNSNGSCVTEITIHFQKDIQYTLNIAIDYNSTSSSKLCCLLLAEVKSHLIHLCLLA